MYLGGESEGGFFAQLYATARARARGSTQPSGTCVAAVSVYVEQPTSPHAAAYDDRCRSASEWLLCECDIGPGDDVLDGVCAQQKELVGEAVCECRSSLGAS